MITTIFSSLGFLKTEWASAHPAHSHPYICMYLLASEILRIRKQVFTLTLALMP